MPHSAYHDSALCCIVQKHEMRYLSKALTRDSVLCGIAQNQHTFVLSFDSYEVIWYTDKPWTDKPWTRQTLDTTNPGHNKPWTRQTLDTTNPGHDKPWTQ
jgi:hypothetical protein